jgi:hypothetical protein
MNKEQFYNQVTKLGLQKFLLSVVVNEGVGSEGYFFNEMPDGAWTLTLTERGKEEQKDHFENETQAFTYMFGSLMDYWVTAGHVIPNPAWYKSS